jgi:hypothetical protein
MRWFDKSELLAIFVILLLVGAVTAVNMNIALRRSRDAQRRGDLSALSEALDSFLSDYGFLPPSEGGRIKFCKGDNYKQVMSALKEKEYFDRNLYLSGLRPCEWGVDGLEGLLDGKRSYLKTIPSDPKYKDGVSYYYLSNTKRYQIYAYLEGEKDETGYDESIVSRNLPCGVKICSYGKSFSDTPLDKSIEEYEDDLRKKTEIKK